MLRRNGVFWQEESYDSLVHDQNDLNRVIHYHYIVQNPVRAGLMDYPWTKVVRREFVPPSVGNAG